MSFHINSDKEKIRGVSPKLIGDNEATIRVGTGANEKEVLRAELDSTTQLPRIGINRTGQRVNNIVLDTAGSGFTVNPTVTIGPPNVAGGIQALASAFTFNGRVTTIAVNNPGSGYTIAPIVTISEGGGTGATATAFLDTVDFELDINGAIRTSTSIISDTARILKSSWSAEVTGSTLQSMTVGSASPRFGALGTLLMMTLEFGRALNTPKPQCGDVSLETLLRASRRQAQKQRCVSCTLQS